MAKQINTLGILALYQALKTSGKAEIDQEAWESLHSAVSRPFAQTEHRAYRGKNH